MVSNGQQSFCGVSPSEGLARHPQEAETRKGKELKEESTTEGHAEEVGPKTKNKKCDGRCGPKKFVNRTTCICQERHFFKTQHYSGMLLHLFI